MGMYQTSLTFKERTRRANVHPLTLGPHGSNFPDVVKVLQSSVSLFDAGTDVVINGKTTRLIVFTHMFLGDMPQQQENSGFKTQRANRGCRFCFVEEKDRGNLEYDLVSQGRFHHQTIQMRQEMNAFETKAMTEKYASKWGRSSSNPPLFGITPALDIILTRPGDPAHSEYKGQSLRLHELLLKAVLTATAVKQYTHTLRSVFPFHQDSSDFSHQFIT